MQPCSTPASSVASVWPPASATSNSGGLGEIIVKDSSPVDGPQSGRVPPASCVASGLYVNGAFVNRDKANGTPDAALLRPGRYRQELDGPQQHRALR